MEWGRNKEMMWHTADHVSHVVTCHYVTHHVNVTGCDRSFVESVCSVLKLFSFTHLFGMPPSKKTKTKNNDAEKQVVTSSRKTSRRGKRGSLQNLPSMPLDILLEVGSLSRIPLSCRSHIPLIDLPVSWTSGSFILVKNEQKLQKVFHQSSDIWPPLEDCDGECRTPPGTYAVPEWASVDQFAFLTSLSCTSLELSLMTYRISEITFRIVSKVMSEPSTGNLVFVIVRRVGRSCMSYDVFLYCLANDCVSIHTQYQVFPWLSLSHQKIPRRSLWLLLDSHDIWQCSFAWSYRICNLMEEYF